MDEAGQAPEPEALCLLSLPKYANRLVLFGDHQQLRPILKSKAAEQAGMGISLFERLAASCKEEVSSRVALLKEQYRMHPSISQFPRSHFYQGRVVDHVSVYGNSCALRHRGREAPFLVWTGRSRGEELQRLRTVGAGGVGSRANVEEATRAVSLAKRLARLAGSVAVLSYYNSQVAKIQELLRREGLQRVHVGSIATAQGSEWDYVILSTVRSDRGRLGLLSDPHTMNVALTRARHGLVVLCEELALIDDPNWAALLRYARAQDIIITEEPEVQVMAPVFGVMPMSAMLRMPAVPPVPPQAVAMNSMHSTPAAPAVHSQAAADAEEQEKLAALLQNLLMAPASKASDSSSSRSRSPHRSNSSNSSVVLDLERVSGA